MQGGLVLHLAPYCAGLGIFYCVTYHEVVVDGVVIGQLELDVGDVAYRQQHGILSIMKILVGP